MVKQADVYTLNGLYPQRNMIKSRNEFLALLKEEAYKKGDFTSVSYTHLRAHET